VAYKSATCDAHRSVQCRPIFATGDTKV